LSVQAKVQPSIKPQPTRRRISVLVLLISIAVTLAALNLAVTGLRTWVQRPAQSVPGGLLYATTFQNANDTDWYQYQSALSAQITNGTLQMSADQAGNGIFSQLNYPFGNFDVDVMTHQLAGDDPFTEYGILFRYQDVNNFYEFKVSADGAYSIVRNLNGSLEDLSPRHSIKGFSSGPNHYNDLRVVGVGNQYRFYLNGQLLTLCPKGNDKRATWANPNSDEYECASNGKQSTQTLIDPTFANGEIALGLFESTGGSSVPVQVAFSNLVVYAPSS
jgi:hypothetical protein